jgi:hypothetical protein
MIITVININGLFITPPLELSGMFLSMFYESFPNEKNSTATHAAMQTNVHMPKPSV